MTLKANRESSNEIASPKNFDSKVNPKDFKNEQAKANISITAKFNLSDKSNIFRFRDSIMEKQ